MLVAARALHFGAALLLFGGFAFLVFVVRPTLRDAGACAEESALHRFLLRLAGSSVVVALVFGALWLGFAAAEMSDVAYQEAWRRDVLGAVLDETRFGQLWKVRFAIAVALGVAVAWSSVAVDSRIRARALALAGLLAALLLTTLALVGHAAAWPGPTTYIGAAADALHLLAAGAWIGALPAFVFLLSRSERAEVRLSIAAAAARRLSTLGMASVSCLAATGLLSSWYLVGSVPALLGTPYGRLLTVKLGLFALMLAFAAANRQRWTPMLERASASANIGNAAAALQKLRRNAIWETSLGFAIVLVVGALGTLTPGAHEQIVWPLPFALTWPELSDLGGLQAAAAAAGVVAGALLIFIFRVRGVGNVCATAIGIGMALVVAVVLCVVPAYPSTYFRSPVPYTATSITRGSVLYAQYCTDCHGAYGYGDGPAAARLPSKPQPLTKRLFDRREGDLFWWIGNGIAGTAMPGFSARLGESERWDLVNFLLADADAEVAKTMNGSVEPWQGTVAPDFTFEMERGPQETLIQQRSRHNVLLIFFTYPESMSRLCILADAKDKLNSGGVRVIAIPMNRESMIAARKPEDERCLQPLIAAGPDSDIVATYTLFRRIPPRVVPAVPKHSEFLIDRQGYLRARWIPQENYVWDGRDDLLRQVATMDRQASPAPAPERPPGGSDLHWH